jgi:serine/threonine-protein kinase
MPLSSGIKLGPYEIQSTIGAGGMGEVYRARDTRLNRDVALKILPESFCRDADRLRRFEQESQAVAALNHPNILAIYDVGNYEGSPFLVSELLEGESLRAVLDRGLLLPRKVIDYAVQIAKGLSAAHDKGIVHRDLKPENIMILSGTDDDGRPKDIVKVCDFGIAKITDSRAYRDGPAGRTSDAPLTTAGLMIGTPEYMSPEQGSGMKLDARSDLYSVGVILFEMLTGRVPFETENAIGTVLKHINEAPPRPSQIAGGVDLRLEAICLRALRKERQDRYPGAREMRAELRAVVGGGPVDARVAEPPPPVQVVTEASASTSAETVRFGVPEHGTPPVQAEPTKPTLVGTTSSVPRPRKPRRFVAVVASAGLVLGLVSVAIVARRHHPAAQPSSADEARRAAEFAGVAPPTDIAPLAPLDPLGPSASPSPVPPGPRAQAQSKPTPAPPSAKGGGARSASAPNATAAPAIAATPAPAPVPAAPPPPPPVAALPTPAPVDTPDPSFDPDHGYVDVGLINGQGVRENAVRGVLHGAGLSACYKTALRAKGSRATGVATLSLSFDESGTIRSAILTDGGFLPGLTRCVQGAAVGLHVASSQVDSGGGTAEVFLAFKVR